MISVMIFKIVIRPFQGRYEFLDFGLNFHIVKSSIKIYAIKYEK